MALIFQRICSCGQNRSEKGQENAGNIYKTWVGDKQKAKNRAGISALSPCSLNKPSMMPGKTRSAYKPRWWLPRTVLDHCCFGCRNWADHFIEPCITKPLNGPAEMSSILPSGFLPLVRLLESAKALFKDWEKLFATDIDTVDDWIGSTAD
jgi:hypothetical protein